MSLVLFVGVVEFIFFQNNPCQVIETAELSKFIAGL